MTNRPVLLGIFLVLSLLACVVHAKNTDEIVNKIKSLQKTPPVQGAQEAGSIVVDGSFPAPYAASLLLGEYLLKIRPDMAVSKLKRAMKSGHRSIRMRAAFGLATAYVRLGQKDQADRYIGWLQKQKRLTHNQQARLLYLRARLDHDRVLMRKLFIQYPGTKWGAPEITGVNENMLTDSELFQRAEGFSEVLDHGQAARIYEKLHDKGFRPVETAWRLARIFLFKLRNNPRRALELLDQVQAERGAGKKLMIARAKAYKMLEDYDHAEAIYREYLRKYPRDRFRARCYYYLGWLPYDHGHYRQAIPRFDTFLRRFRRNPLRTYILWFKAWSQIKINDLTGAEITLKRMIPYGNNLVAGKAMYWLGVVAHRLHDSDASRQWFKKLISRYPMTYYSVLAWKRLAQWYGEKGPAWVDDPRGVQPDPRPYWGTDKLRGPRLKIIQRVKVLSELGFTDEAWIVYKKHRRWIEQVFRGTAAIRFMTTVYGATGRWHELTERGARRFRHYFGPVPSAKTTVYWTLAYPRAEYEFVRKFASREGVDPLWVYSIMRQESRFRLSKVSVADALGIMQMIPETAKRVARELGTKYDPFEFFKPAVNIRFCVHYLGSLLKDFKGQILFASAAYNGGAPPIRRMMLANRGAPLDKMVENIAYNQSRNYCRKVTEHMLRYIRIYARPTRRRQLLKALYPDPVDYDLGHRVDY